MRWNFDKMSRGSVDEVSVAKINNKSSIFVLFFALKDVWFYCNNTDLHFDSCYEVTFLIDSLKTTTWIFRDFLGRCVLVFF